MRYILRNQKKIKDALGKDILSRIIRSLVHDFQKCKKLDVGRCDGDDYDTLIINDIDHTVNVIAFYVIKKKFDVYTLAFKEFIG